MAWLNLFLLMLEFLTLSVCQYEFLSHNERMIYLKKGWYFLLFFVDYAALFAATALTGCGKSVVDSGDYFRSAGDGSHRFSPEGESAGAGRALRCVSAPDDSGRNPGGHVAFGPTGI